MAQVLFFGDWERVKDLQNQFMRKVDTYGFIRKGEVKEALTEIDSQRPPVMIVIDEKVSFGDRKQIQDAAEAAEPKIKTTIIDCLDAAQRQHFIQRLKGEKPDAEAVEEN